MATITVKNASGKDAGTVDLDDDMFGVQPNVPVMHQVVTAQLAARRSGTQSTKTRAEVRGGGRKPFKQKGTGNARQGSIRAPHFSGGGVALGPKPRKYDQKTPKKMIKLALRSALSDRAAEGKIVVVDSWGFDAPKTKDRQGGARRARHRRHGPRRRRRRRRRQRSRASATCPRCSSSSAGELNAYDVLCNDWIVFTKDVVPASVVADRADAAKPAKKAAVSADTESRRRRRRRRSVRRGQPRPARRRQRAEGFPIKGNADSMLYHGPDSATTARPSPKCGSPPRKRPKRPVLQAGQRSGCRGTAPVRRGQSRRQRGRQRAEGLPDQGQRRLDALPRARTARTTTDRSPKCGSPPRKHAEAAGFSKPASVQAAEEAAEEAAADDEDTKEGD